MPQLEFRDTSKIFNMIKDSYKHIKLVENKEGLYIRCDEGWKNIIDECLKRIDTLCEVYNKKVVFEEVKEKFGQCRLYVDVDYDNEFKSITESAQDNKSFTQAVDRAISVLESSSEETCEVCGAKSKGVVKTKASKHWVKSICEKCDEELYQKGLIRSQMKEESIG